MLSAILSSSLISFQNSLVRVKRGTGMAESGMRNPELQNPVSGIRNAVSGIAESGIAESGIEESGINYLVLKTRYLRSGTLLTDNNSSKAQCLPSLLTSVFLSYISGIKK